jgi:hypothetical protein
MYRLVQEKHALECQTVAVVWAVNIALYKSRYLENLQSILMLHMLMV